LKLLFPGRLNKTKFMIFNMSSPKL